MQNILVFGNDQNRNIVAVFVKGNMTFIENSSPNNNSKILF